MLIFVSFINSYISFYFFCECQEIEDIDAEAIAMAALDRFTAMPLDRQQAFSLLRTVASLCEDFAEDDDEASNRIFNIAYYFIWSILKRDSSGRKQEKQLKCFYSHVRRLCAASFTFKDGKCRVDDQINLWLVAAGC